MPSKRRAFLHVGLDDGSGDVLDAALGTHAHALLALGVRRPCESGSEMFRAALDVLGTHTDWGMRREEVDGAWDRVARRARRGRDTIVVSQPLLATAPTARARAVVEGLEEFEVHAVVTVRAPDAWSVPGDPARDLPSVLDRWAGAVRAPERMHVVIGDDHDVTWRAFGRLAGFGTSSVKAPPSTAARRLPVPSTRAAGMRQLARSWAELLAASPYHVVGDVEDLEPDVDLADSPDELVLAAGRALEDARHELERIGHRNEELERRLAAAARGPGLLKRRLSRVG